MIIFLDRISTTQRVFFARDYEIKHVFYVDSTKLQTEIEYDVEIYRSIV